jgi:UPF0176 protein
MYQVSAFYRFVALESLPELRRELLASGQAAGLCGTILLADEGINATIAGQPESLRGFMQALAERPQFAGIEEKISSAAEKPFRRFKVRLKREIVTLGAGPLDPARQAGTYVPPEQWNELISRDDVVVVDTRNEYETGIGRFRGAVDPQTRSFREFPRWVREHLDPARASKIAMYCTGGIRCEKATALLRREGFKEVYHLEGGILKYLEQVPPEQSLWQGECFVFDERVGLEHGLVEGNHELCRSCGYPQAPGSACPRCPPPV